ncbi:glutathione S-transferase [Penicillium verhagenii]|uniref:glutathione S-transferase n=1 Tax=Penicillium verhagenii TaxID=1562060 RepID=UPI002545590B|nr:glutathione S-transferase [Penicillium verhagenii]KAJ5939539.1 glutathione S-transferase [Penicillium verhagenii]
MKESNVKFYTSSTPSGVKVSIALEELGIPHKLEHLDISTSRQEEPWFLEINLDGRIPAITDTLADGIFESGSILIYLAEQYEKIPQDQLPSRMLVLDPCKAKSTTLSAFRLAPQKIQYAIDRYVTEVRRLYSVIEKRLQQSKSGFLVGDHISLADITTVGWVIWSGFAGVDMTEFPAIVRWERMLNARHAVAKGLDVPKPLKIRAATAGNSVKRVGNVGSKMATQTKTRSSLSRFLFNHPPCHQNAPNPLNI